MRVFTPWFELSSARRDEAPRFYGAADRLLVATRFERELLLADGFAPERIEIVGEVGAPERVGETVGRAPG